MKQPSNRQLDESTPFWGWNVTAGSGLIMRLMAISMTTSNKSAMKRTTFQQEYIISHIHFNLECVDEVTITRASFDWKMRYLAYNLTRNNLHIDSLMKIHHIGGNIHKTIMECNYWFRLNQNIAHKISSIKLALKTLGTWPGYTHLALVSCLRVLHLLKLPLPSAHPHTFVNLAAEEPARF